MYVRTGFTLTSGGSYPGMSGSCQLMETGSALYKDQSVAGETRATIEAEGFSPTCLMGGINNYCKYIYKHSLRLFLPVVKFRSFQKIGAREYPYNALHTGSCVLSLCRDVRKF